MSAMKSSFAQLTRISGNKKAGRKILPASKNFQKQA